MGLTDNLKKQHQEILGIAGEISSELNIKNLQENPNNVVKLLSKLSGKLKFHLTMEDQSLYPKLINHENVQINTMANKFVDEMGGIAKAFTEFMSKWNNSENIKSEPQEFIKETKNLFVVVSKRIEKEDNQLYKKYDEIS